MTQAVTHFLVAAIVVNLIRDFLIRDKKSFPLHLVLIGGIAGLLPDFDVAAYWLLNYAGFTITEVHRTFTHTLFVPLLFFLLSFIFWKAKSRKLSRAGLTWSNILLVLGIGTFIHLLLDGIVAGYIKPFYPVLNLSIGLNLMQYLPSHFQNAFLPSLDALLLMLWMIYIEVKHKISNFI
ncbi:metal-dependent hydrolase [Candidatus Pacearchaeota archaeon]|nr:metal-dependent hydrolase [Candidatus Pacearchaeota archaeon]